MVGGASSGDDGSYEMKANAKSRHDWMVGLSLGIAGIFIYAGADKLRDPLQFADSIAAFAILPSAAINLFALGLPPFEIASGLLMLTPRSRRIGALAVAFLSLIFFSALSSALARGLTLDCGCFGSGTPSRPRMWAELALDTILFAGAALVYAQSIGLVRASSDERV
jgi:putative oxidoreductase